MGTLNYTFCKKAKKKLQNIFLWMIFKRNFWVQKKVFQVVGYVKMFFFHSFLFRFVFRKHNPIPNAVEKPKSGSDYASPLCPDAIYVHSLEDNL